MFVRVFGHTVLKGESQIPGRKRGCIWIELNGVKNVVYGTKFRWIPSMLGNMTSSGAATLTPPIVTCWNASSLFARKEALFSTRRVEQENIGLSSWNADFQCKGQTNRSKCFAMLRPDSQMYLSNILECRNSPSLMPLMGSYAWTQWRWCSRKIGR